MDTYLWALGIGAGLMGVMYLWGRSNGASNERRKQAERDREAANRVVQAMAHSPTSKSAAIDELRKSGQL